MFTLVRSILFAFFAAKEANKMLLIQVNILPDSCQFNQLYLLNSTIVVKTKLVDSCVKLLMSLELQMIETFFEATRTIKPLFQRNSWYISIEHLPFTTNRQCLFFSSHIQLNFSSSDKVNVVYARWEKFNMTKA